MKRGTLTAAEAGELRVPVLAAAVDPTLRLEEAAGLVARSLISAEEFGRLKARLIAQTLREA